jgi:hypothetical protein
MMINFFLDDGLFMYPFLLVFVVGMAITIEHWFHLNRVRGVNRKMRDVLHLMPDKGAFDKPRTVINKDKSISRKCCEWD